MSVYLNKELYDRCRKVIALNGQILKLPRFTPKAETILECYERWWDPQRLYPMKIELKP